MGENGFEKPRAMPEDAHRGAAKALEIELLAQYGDKLPKLAEQLELMFATADATVAGRGNYRLRMNNIYNAAIQEYSNMPDVLSKLATFKENLDNYLP